MQIYSKQTPPQIFFGKCFEMNILTNVLKRTSWKSLYSVTAFSKSCVPTVQSLNFTKMVLPKWPDRRRAEIPMYSQQHLLGGSFFSVKL